MSRSRRKTPVCGHTTAESEKKDKRIHNRKFRRLAKTVNDPDSMPQKSYEVTDPWTMDKDGKQRFDPGQFPRGMRK